MRLVHLSPDLGPIDFCWRLSGAATFNGPMLGPFADGGAGGGDAGSTDTGSDGAAGDATLADSGASDSSTASDGGLHAFDFGSMSGDVTLPAAGTLDIALVSAWQQTCGQPLLVGQVTLDAGKHATVAVMGLARVDAAAQQALSLTSFTDDTTADAQNARVRMIHAALGWSDGSGPAPALDARVGQMLVAAQIDPRHASAASSTPPVDALGYATLAPVTSYRMLHLDSLPDAGPATWSTPNVDLQLLAGSMHTGFVVGHPQGALGVLWCSEAKTSGATAMCGLLTAN
jgi:hypothetical protein